MNRKLILLLAFVSMFFSYLAVMNYRSNPDRLFAELIEQMEAGEFQNIYNESSEFTRLNVNKEEFIKRMATAFAKMKDIDENLNFQRDEESELQTERIRCGSESVSTCRSSNELKVFQRLGKDQKSVLIFVYWRWNGLYAEFRDLSILPDDKHQQDYFVKGIAYKE